MKQKKKNKLGLAFTEEIFKVTQPFGHFKRKKAPVQNLEDVFLPNFKSEENEEKVSLWRLVILGSLVLATFFILFLRLFHLQIVKGEENRTLADSNRIKLKIIHAPRGVIYDRKGKVLAESNPGFRLGKKFISRDQALLLEAKNDPDFENLEIDAIRFYPEGEAFSHVLGYVGQISEEELKDPKFAASYKTGDLVGRSGIEQIYEEVLRGKDGAEIIEVNSLGKHLRTIRKVDPTPGKNLYLSIESTLQKIVFKALQEEINKARSCCGVAVMMDPKTGQILTLVSLPSFDSNVFTDPHENKEIEAYFTNPDSPLLNRAISGVYPPGSTFKIASALAGLSTGKINKDTQFEDTGVMFLGPYKFSNWYFNQYGKTEGLLDIVKALQRSNDIFFYKVGERVGEKVLGETAKKVGLGKKLGIDLPAEADGLIPDNTWKKKNIGEVWYPGDTLHLAIGQGFILATPLQILAQTSFIASGGSLPRPYLVTQITNSNGALVKKFHFDPIIKDIFKKEDLDLVKMGLSLVPKMGGTAWPFFSFSIPTAGKTGTAEYGDASGKTHAWYTSYAPADNPQIALTVLIEGGGEGSSVSAPVAHEIYTWYFNPDKSNIKSLDSSPVLPAAKTLGE